MTAFYRQKSRGLIYIFLLVTIFIFLPITVVAVDNPETEKNDDATEGTVELNFEVIKGDYEYQIENRSDPFVPFYTGEAATAELNPNEIVESSSSKLTGMQLYEPGQLNLVALMQHGGMYVAMVEDFKGQGYVIQEGTKIGRRGTVKQIIANKVLIEEVAVTRAGKELRSEIVMALRKEGEE